MKRAVLLILLVSIGLGSSYAATRDPAAIIDRVNQVFSRIKDGSADITLDYNTYIFGCSGLTRFNGKLYFKSPDRLKIELKDYGTYFLKGNSIRKIDTKGKKFYIRLIHAPDFSAGFNPRLITHNFNLKLIKDDQEEIVIEGLPKPGILKNVTKVTFHIDPKEYLLNKMDLEMINRRLSGDILIGYEKIGGIWTPTGFYGKSAIELRDNFLVGLGISLKGGGFRLNSGLPFKFFDPGF